MNTNIGEKALSSTLMDQLDVGGAVIEYQVQGNGEPVLLIPPAATIDGLGLPLFSQPLLTSRYQLIRYHRRGYMGSTPGQEPFSIALAAGDAAALLRYLNVNSAHIAGHSIGGLIALQLAVDAPDMVHSLALLEPSLPMAPSGKGRLGDLFQPVMSAYRAGNKPAAIMQFCDAVYGPNWQYIVEQYVPGAVEQAIRDADVTIQELAAIPTWQFGPQEIAAIHNPVLSVLGTHTSQFMKEGRILLHSWFPQSEDLDLPTTHLLEMQEPQGMAHGLSEFFARHPIN